MFVEVGSVVKELVSKMDVSFASLGVCCQRHSVSVYDEADLVLFSWGFLLARVICWN